MVVLPLLALLLLLVMVSLTSRCDISGSGYWSLGRMGREGLLSPAVLKPSGTRGNTWRPLTGQLYKAVFGEDGKG